MNISDKIEAAKAAMKEAVEAYSDGNPKALRRSLAAQQRLLQIIDSLLEEREEAVANIDALQRVLSLTSKGSSEQTTKTVKHEEPQSDFGKQPVWKQARVALRHAGRPLEVGEIVEGIKLLGGRAGKHPTATVQNGIKRYIGTIFTRAERQNRYIYGLFEWGKVDEDGKLELES